MPNLKARIFAFFTGRSAEDWQTNPGEEFRATQKAVGEFCEKSGITPDNVSSSINSALKGAATEKLAHAMNEAAEREKRLAETAQILRSADINNKNLELDAQSKGLANAKAYLELLKQFHELKVAGVLDELGVTHYLPSPNGFDIRQAPALTQGTSDDLPRFSETNVMNVDMDKMDYMNRSVAGSISPRKGRPQEVINLSRHSKDHATPVESDISQSQQESPQTSE